MKRNTISSIVGIVLMALIGSYVVPMSAQATAAPCDVDLSQATAMMAQAQAKASSGDTDGAMALLDQVTQAISDIKEQCASSGAPVDLSQTYTDPSGIFTVNYPAGWVTELMPGSSSVKSKEQPIVLASDKTVYDGLMGNKPFPTGQGVVVYVGPVKEVLQQLNAYDSSKTYSDMTALSVLESVITSQGSHAIKFGGANKVSAIGTYDAAEASVSFLDPSVTNVVVDGSLMIVQFASDQFALVLGVAGPGKGASIVPFTHSIAATIKVKAAQ